MSIYLGIDPGVSGGLAAITDGGNGDHVYTTKMQEEDIDQWLWLLDHTNQTSTYAVMEKVQGWIGKVRGKDGEEAEGNQPASRIFKLGQSYGTLRMALVALGLVEGDTFEVVAPRTWQCALFSPTQRVAAAGQGKNERRKIWKGVLKNEAERLFPQVKVTLATADALLLAYYCKLKYGG